MIEIVHAAPVGAEWSDTAQAAVIQPSAVVGLAHRVVGEVLPIGAMIYLINGVAEKYPNGLSRRWADASEGVKASRFPSANLIMDLPKIPRIGSPMLPFFAVPFVLCEV